MGVSAVAARLLPKAMSDWSDKIRSFLLEKDG